jgi:hypothetical protein
VPLKERLGELLAAIFVFAFLLLMAFGMYTWLVNDILPEKWSDAIQDVFVSADEKRARADALLRHAASLKVEADSDLKELGAPPSPEYGSKYGSDLIDAYQDNLAEINEKYRYSAALVARSAELQRKANSSKPPREPKQQQ